MTKHWNQAGNTFSLREVSHQKNKLTPGVYITRITPLNEIYLEHLQETFPMPSPLYGCEHAFVERVLRTYRAMRANLGVLLTGVKGTGKTVTCQMIANKLGLPVIIVDDSFDGKITDFLAEIQQDVTFFFDEFEKNFSEGYNKGAKLLPVMDGVFKNGSRKLFLLTTNELTIEPNLIQRPGRIRYIKEFGNLNLETIMEIIDHRLEKTHRRDELIKYISTLETITIDIVTSIVDEVNIHDDSPEEFGAYFNVKKLRRDWDVYEVFEKAGRVQEKLLYPFSQINPNPVTPQSVDDEDTLYVNGRGLGLIIEVADGGLVTTRHYKRGDEEESKPIKRTFRLEAISSTHGSFRTYGGFAPVEAI